MQDANGLLGSLQQLGVKFSTRNGRLCFQIPDGLPAKELSQLRTMIELLERTQFSTEFPLRPRAEGCMVPLIAVQRHTWNYYKQEPRLSVRICTAAVRVLGPLNTGLLRRSIDAVVQRHESLRTRFVAIDGIPQQHIDSVCQDHWDVVDLAGLPSDGLEAEVRHQTDQFVDEKVDLSTGPLFKAKLFRLSATEHVLILAAEHLISDGVSMEILDREIWTLYGHGGQGRASLLPALPVQFPDYAVWQHQTYGARLQKHYPYWQGRLRGAPNVQIPLDDGMADGSDANVAMVEIPFGDTLSNRLRDTARRERTLLALVVLTVYVIVMSRWCQQADVVVSFASDGRFLPELEGMTGFLAKVLYLRVEVNEAARLRDVLQQVSREFNAAYEHLDSDWIVPDVVPECATDLGFNWLTTYWKWARWSADQQRLVDDQVRIQPFPQKVSLQPTKFSPWFSDTATGVYVTVLYRTDRFRLSTIERFGQDLRSLANEFIQRPHSSVSAAMAAVHTP